jgi:hypothetical protein
LTSCRTRGSLRRSVLRFAKSPTYSAFLQNRVRGQHKP